LTMSPVSTSTSDKLSPAMWKALALTHNRELIGYADINPATREALIQRGLLRENGRGALCTSPKLRRYFSARTWKLTAAGKKIWETAAKLVGV
jgi:hypothetical protein